MVVLQLPTAFLLKSGTRKISLKAFIAISNYNDCNARSIENVPVNSCFASLKTARAGHRIAISEGIKGQHHPAFKLIPALTIILVRRIPPGQPHHH